MEEYKTLILNILAENIKGLRQKHKLSQEKLAEKSSLDRTYISLLERSKRNPSLTNLVKISKGLGVDIQELLKGM